MAKPASSNLDTSTSRTALKTQSFGISDIRATTRTTVLFLYVVIILFGILFALFFSQTLQIPSSFTQTTTVTTQSWSLSDQLQKLVNMTTSTFSPRAAPKISMVKEAARNSQLEVEIEGLVQKLRRSVTFLPLKDLRFAHSPMEGNTWFMSSLEDIREEGEVQHMKFPSESSLGRVLCLKGNNSRDGTQNGYALAWADALPPNATYMQDLTFVSQSHYIYENPWHGISAIHPFVAWHQMDHCRPVPERWVLFFQGELRTDMGPWLNNITDAAFERPTYKEAFDGVNGPVCFEEAVVLRHGGAGLSKERVLEAYDLLRCKARKYCKLGVNRGVEPGVLDIGLTVLMRKGARSFRNESEVVRVFQKECDQVDGCRLMVAHSDDLSFCDQVKLMSKTDILISPHGGQLANLFMMDRNGSVMELYPKGFHLLGPGQYVFHWMANWSGMRHTGIWRDPQGDCPYPEVEDPRCTQFNKNGRIGLNETYFAEWSRTVLQEVKMRKTEQLSNAPLTSECICRSR